jgi:hypothetical protein
MGRFSGSALCQGLPRGFERREHQRSLLRGKPRVDHERPVLVVLATHEAAAVLHRSQRFIGLHFVLPLIERLFV